MSPRPLELHDVLSRFHAPTDAIFNLRQAVMTCLRAGNPREAFSYAESALRDGLMEHDRHMQAFACALLAAAYASQRRFDAAVQQGEDCYRLFNQMGDQIHNAMVAKMLLAVIHQMHLDAVGSALIEALQEGQAHSKAMIAKALGKGATEVASEYEEQFAEFDNWIRRSRWVQAFPHLLPLVWVPVIHSIPSDLDTQGADIEAYLGPVLFVLKTKQEVEDKGKGAPTPAQPGEVLYTARPLPLSGDFDAVSSPPRLKPNVVYAAIKIDPESARLPDFKPDDYLLVRKLSSAERLELLQHADRDISGLYFEVDANGQVEFVNAIPPKFVGEEHVRMFVAQADAILRRVP